MIKNILHYFFLLFLLGTLFTFSCKNVKKNDSNDIELTEINNSTTKDTIQQVHFAFFDVISEYFCNRIYYSDIQWFTFVYFAKKDSTNYFTIWSDLTYPYYVEPFDTLASTYNCYSIVVNNTELILITDKKSTDTIFSTFMIPTNAVKIDSFKMEMERNQNLIYEGRLFIESYKYKLINGSLKIEKLDTPIVEFLGNAPEQFW